MHITLFLVYIIISYWSITNYKLNKGVKVRYLKL